MDEHRNVGNIITINTIYSQGSVYSLRMIACAGNTKTTWLSRLKMCINTLQFMIIK